MNKALKIVIKDGTKIDVYFFDGVVKRYDVLSLADRFPQLNELKNRSVFEKVKLLGTSTVQWNDELDIDVEVIYDDGIDVTKDYDDVQNVIIGYIIKERRIDLQLSQEELAKRVGIDQSDLSKIEKGNANPSIKMINKIADGLNSRISISLK